jgi:phage gp45-like
MHRATPLQTSFRAYTSGGARSAVHEIDDSKGMQLSKANGMKNETRENIESPQNYGFTSVCADGDQGDNGSLKDSAECILNYIGGNRSFPMATSMDDRRHRLLNLAKDAVKGASAMFGLKKWGQQLLNTEDGWFMTGNTQKKVRLQLVNNSNDQQQQPQQSGGQGSGGSAGTFVDLPNGRRVFRSKSGVEFDAAPAPRANGGGSGSGGGNGSSSGSQGQQQEKGQKTLHKEDSNQYFDMTTGSLHQGNGSSHHEVKGDRTVGYYDSNDKSYRADSGHSHIKNTGGHVWVSGACFKSTPFVLKPDPCS